MGFEDISSRFKGVKKEAKTKEAPGPVDFAESYRIRAKMVGVLIRDARISANRTPADCAAQLRVEPTQIERWEYGEGVPSLPQIEVLADYLDVPVSHFWGMDTLTDDDAVARGDTRLEYMALRDRMIGALLRQAREEAGLDLAAVSQKIQIPVETLTRYELGEIAIPMHELSVLASTVNRNISYFLETSSHIGQVLAAKQEWQHFNDLPEEVRKFAADPLNLGFIEIAIMFSQMPTEKLRRVAESMLEITM